EIPRHPVTPHRVIVDDKDRDRSCGQLCSPLRGRRNSHSVPDPGAVSSVAVPPSCSILPRIELRTPTCPSAAARRNLSSETPGPSSQTVTTTSVPRSSSNTHAGACQPTSLLTLVNASRVAATSSYPGVLGSNTSSAGALTRTCSLDSIRSAEPSSTSALPEWVSVSVLTRA